MASQGEESSFFDGDNSFDYCPIPRALARTTVAYSRNNVKHQDASMEAPSSFSAKANLCWPSLFSYVVIPFY